MNSDERANLNSPLPEHSRSDRKKRRHLKTVRGEQEDRIDKNEKLRHSTATLASADISWIVS
uniref:BZIP domain-containing protein n=1 Tax=Ascaris lumbricoides TaxID=6252 RepID=A0A0M3IE05_ASCLU